MNNIIFGKIPSKYFFMSNRFSHVCPLFEEMMPPHKVVGRETDMDIILRFDMENFQSVESYIKKRPDRVPVICQEISMMMEKLNEKYLHGKAVIESFVIDEEENVKLVYWECIMPIDEAIKKCIDGKNPLLYIKENDILSYCQEREIEKSWLVIDQIHNIVNANCK